MKVLAIVGSPHKNGNTVYLLEKVLGVLKPFLSVEITFLRDYNINPCEGCHWCEKKLNCKIKDDMQKLYPKVKEANILLLASPVYMGGVTSRMRIFMERTWFLRKGQLKGKLASFVLTGRREIGAAVWEMEEYLNKLNVIKVPGIVGYGFKIGEIKKDEEALKKAEELGKKILNLLKDLKN